MRESISWLAASLIASAAFAQPTSSPAARDTMPDTWVGVDALGRALPSNADVGAPRSDRFVAMFYFTWLGGHATDQVFDLTKILAANGDRPQSAARFGPVGAFHWWGEPYFGHYRSDDTWVIRKHAQLLADAGVDVIVCDVTNAFTYDDVVEKIFDTYADIRAHGGRTPKVAFIANARHVDTVKRLYDKWYKPGLHRELWFEWQGKPLIMANPEGMPDEIRNFFTFRRSWAFTGANERKPDGWFGDGKEKWPWVDNYPQSFGWRDAPDQPEAMSVAIATHPIAGVGRSHDGTAQPLEGASNSTVGTYFQKQWDRAIEVGPELIFVTGWNEWVAQRFEWGKPARVGFVGYLKPKEGDSYFVDQYSEEFSRDAEPMRGGYGDNYYCQLAANIRRFKGARAPLVPDGEGDFTWRDNGGDFGAWADVRFEYLDDLRDVAIRDAAGFDQRERFYNDNGRNDIESVKVVATRDTIYFYVRCVAPIVQPNHQNRLWLLINADGRADTGIAGFELLVNGRAVSDVKVSVERITPDARATANVAAVPFVMRGNELQIAIPRRLLTHNGRLSFDFKWADNLPKGRLTAMNFLDGGDTAPNARWGYRFELPR